MNNLLHSLMRGFLRNGESRIVVASTGRSGSTMLAQALAVSWLNDRFGSRGPPSAFLLDCSVQFMRRLSKFGPLDAKVIKTHDTNPGIDKGNGTYIFVYGDPLDSVLSAIKQAEIHGESWLLHHISNLRGWGSPDDILSQDILNYEGQMHSWCSDPSVLSIHYDDLWDNVSALSERVGFSVALPEKRERRHKEAPDHFDRRLFNRLKSIEESTRNGVNPHIR